MGESDDRSQIIPTIILKQSKTNQQLLSTVKSEMLVTEEGLMGLTKKYIGGTNAYFNMYKKKTPI